ncbi:MAG TPA: sensor histidine kinase [Sporosarcina sp.]|nr:sensor histidine kinase [Sporosarcina sp.]
MNIIRLFVRDHVSFLIFQGFLTLFLFVLFWLDGFREYGTFLYAFFIIFIFTFSYLGMKLFMRRTYYQTIMRKPHRMEDALLTHVHGTVPKQASQYMRGLYKVYQDEAQSLYSGQTRQIEFMNHWVHQMKTPISVVNLLLQETTLDRQSIAEELERLQAGLNTVLLSASLETFERDMTIEQLNLKQLVQETINEHKRLLITNKVFPAVSIEEDIDVASDRKWLKIIISQFITNAVKYTFEEGKKIYVTAEVLADEIAFSIQDEGIGIPKSDMNRITNAFFTGENGRLTGESTGMGLYIAAEVCEKLSHRLQIESEPNVGTTVTLYFKRLKGGA